MGDTVYKDITDYPGYRVGSDGTVWRRWVTCRSGRKLTDTWRPMKLSPGHKGYYRVNLTPPDGGSYRTFFVHVLVLEAFVGPRPEGMECRHFPDTNKSNNRVGNLSWGTPERNRDDNHETGAYGRGESHTQAVMTDDDIRTIRSRRASGEPLKVLAADFNTTQGHISMIANRRIWKHVV